MRNRHINTCKIIGKLHLIELFVKPINLKGKSNINMKCLVTFNLYQVILSGALILSLSVFTCK